MLRDRMGVMPPWFIEKDVGIQDYQNDISLSDAEITMIAEWADNGAPCGDPNDMQHLVCSQLKMNGISVPQI